MDRDPVYSVTSARSGQRDEIGGRERRYVISMAIRTVCFVGAVVAWQTGIGSESRNNDVTPLRNVPLLEGKRRKLIPERRR